MTSGLGNDVSVTKHRHASVRSSTTTKTRKQRPSAGASEWQSRLQRSLWLCGSAIGMLVRKGRSRPPWPCTCSRSSRQRRHSFLVACDEACAGQKNLGTALTEPATPGRELTHSNTNGGIIRRLAAVAHRGTAECRSPRRSLPANEQQRCTTVSRLATSTSFSRATECLPGTVPQLKADAPYILVRERSEGTFRLRVGSAKDPVPRN